MMKRAEYFPHDKLYVQHVKRFQKCDMLFPHYHDAYEIYFQIAGKRYMFFDNICHVFETGDVAILKPFEIHYGESQDSEFYERYVINFKDELFSKLLSEEEQYLLKKKMGSCVIHLNNDEMKKLKMYIDIIEEYSKKSGFLSEKLLASAVLQMVMFLISFMDQKLDLGKATMLPIVEVLKYIDCNYQESITLDKMAKIAHMSKYHFCHMFRSVTGVTAMYYVKTVRLTRAHNLLIHTTEQLEEIARKSGFTSYVNLSRAFKSAYGMSPRNFRKMYGKEDEGGRNEKNCLEY